MRKMSVLMLCSALLFGVATEAMSQQFTGSVRGSVRDAQGIIPGVTVTLTNEGTTIGRDTVTNAVGEYAFPAVPPATYSIRTSLPGYKTYEQRGINIGTQQAVTLDLVLEVGTVEEEITVTADAPLIETSNASLGASLDREMLEMLPAPGRNAYLIAVTIPTVTPVGDPQYNRQQDQTNASRISLGGGGIRANNYLLDGVPVTEIRGRAVLNTTIEALGDVKVQIHTYDAEMGRTGGGVFNATAKTGTNEFHGTGFYQTRPVWGESLPYFAAQRGESKQTSGVSEKFYRLFGWGGGGPIWQNRTFFWTAAEGYRSQTTRELNRTYPTARQRTGDLSGTTEGGVPISIWNPYCRSGVASAQCPATGPSGTLANPQFANAIIPSFALDPVALNMMSFYPLPTVRPNGEDSNRNQTIVGSLVDTADMWTGKVEHKFSDNWSLSGLYVYNKTDEPSTADPTLTETQAQAVDGGIWRLKRRPHVFVANNTNVINDTTVITARYGWTTWFDSGDGGNFAGGPGALGFSSTFVNDIHPDGRTIHPDVRFDDGSFYGAQRGDAPQDRRWNGPAAINVGISKLAGSHTYKMGGDFRQLGVSTTTTNNMAGRFDFDKNPTRGPAGQGGYDFASFLVGVPSPGSDANIAFNRGIIDVSTRYYSGYFQDDWRVRSNFTLNWGIRFEHEDGMREANNRFSVAFDKTAVSPLNGRLNANGVAVETALGQQILGGLVYAGVNGANTHQGNPPAAKISPRFGMTYSVDDLTVVRGGYGLFYAPWQYSGDQFGQTGFARNTSLVNPNIDTAAPTVTLTNPYPGGLIAPPGDVLLTDASLGLLQGVGGTVSFIDPNMGAPRVHQYSVDIQRQLPGDMAITVGYSGATGRDLGFGGTGNEEINLNQINPAGLARDASGRWDAAALRRLVPNPFFGVEGAGEFSSLSMIEAGKLQRPFPQFGNVRQFNTTEGGKRQFNALIIKLDKRTASGFGGRFSYTWSSTKDNQWGQGNTFTNRESQPQNYYNIDAEYGSSAFESPHRIILAPIVRIPGPGEDRPLAYAVLGGWSASAIVELVSGAPSTAYAESNSSRNLGLFGGLQRPNLTGAAIGTSGSDTDRVASAGQLDARFFNRAAFADPGRGAYGNAPRTHPDGRAQFRKNLDFVLAKNTDVGAGAIAQVRFEILNATNTPKFRGASTNINRSSFGQIGDQAGFSRIWQISFRLTY